MATTPSYRDYILEQLRYLDGIRCKAMMGEFLLYFDGVLFGGIYDNRLLLKRTKTNEKYGMAEAIPYEGAKPMYFMESTDDIDLLEKVIYDTYQGLSKHR